MNIFVDEKLGQTDNKIMTEFDSRRGSNKKGILRKFHYGLVSVSDGKSRPQSSRIKLCSDYITLQREEFHIWEDEDTYNVEAGLRTVSLARADDGTLGISIKGGSEYNLPILISRVTSDCEKARCGRGVEHSLDRIKYLFDTKSAIYYIIIFCP